jgi:hypothetical protein
MGDWLDFVLKLEPLLDPEVFTLSSALLRLYPWVDGNAAAAASLATRLENTKPLHMTTTTEEGWLFADNADAKAFFSYQVRTHVLRAYHYDRGTSSKWGDLAYLRRLRRAAEPYIRG